jgi:hypothetical protein
MSLQTDQEHPTDVVEEVEEGVRAGDLLEMALLHSEVAMPRLVEDLLVDVGEVEVPVVVDAEEVVLREEVEAVFLEQIIEYCQVYLSKESLCTRWPIGKSKENA